MINTMKYTWKLLNGSASEEDFPEFNKPVMILVEQDIVEQTTIDECVYYPGVYYAILQDRSWFGGGYKWILIDADDVVQPDETVIAWRYI